MSILIPVATGLVGIIAGWLICALLGNSKMADIEMEMMKACQERVSTVRRELLENFTNKRAGLEARIKELEEADRVVPVQNEQGRWIDERTGQYIRQPKK